MKIYPHYIITLNHQKPPYGGFLVIKYTAVILRKKGGGLACVGYRLLETTSSCLRDVTVAEVETDDIHMGCLLGLLPG